MYIYKCVYGGTHELVACTRKKKKQNGNRDMGQTRYPRGTTLEISMLQRINMHMSVCHHLPRCSDLTAR